MSNCNCNNFNNKLINAIIELINEKDYCDENCKCLLCKINKCNCGKIEVFRHLCKNCSDFLCSHCSYFNKETCLKCKPYK